jgi:hypothetical protein
MKMWKCENVKMWKCEMSTAFYEPVDLFGPMTYLTY